MSWSLTDYAVENSDTFLASIPQGDIRHHLDKFQPDTFNKNLPALKELYKFAHEVKNTTLESLALSWIVTVSKQEISEALKK